MTLLQSELLGAVVPQILHRPPDVASLDAAEEAIELADAYGICGGHPLDESQKFTLRNSLGERADGSWSATTIGDFEPRQNGKNDTIAARELAGLILFGEQLIIHTAHEFPTANESFLRLVSVFDNWDDLRKRVQRIRYANGEQGIELINGARLKYRARTGGSGRGFAKADLVVYDEAQHLQAEHVAASGPARLANPNSQSWYSGSGGLSTSANAWRMRRRALAGNGGRFAYCEHTAEIISISPDGEITSTLPDLYDREAWARANAAYGRRITDESMLGLFEELGPDLAMRECLCVWDPEPSKDNETWVLPRPEYERAKSTESIIPESADRCLAIATSPDRDWTSLAVAGESSLGGTHVGVLKYGEGTAWVADEVKRYGTTVAVAKDSPAMSLVPELKKAGLKVEEFTTQEQGQAFAQLFDLVATEQFHHPGQAHLDLSVKCAELRLTEGGVSLLSPKRSSVDISPLVAVTLAVGVAQRPKVSRKAVVAWS